MQPYGDVLVQQYNSLNLNPERAVCGPLLRYIGIEYGTGTYRVSCLLVSTDHGAPQLQVQLRNEHNETRDFSIPSEKLDSFRGQYHFWRYELRLPLESTRQVVTYQSEAFGPQKFHLSAYNESTIFMFYLYSGFSDLPQETKVKFDDKQVPLWQDVL